MKAVWGWVGASALLLGLVSSLVFVFLSVGRAEPLETLPVRDLPLLGRTHAPHEIVLVSDYQCPACRRFHAEVLPELMRRYVDSGQAHLRVAVFPVKPGSTELARAVHCLAQAPGQDWSALYDRVYREDFHGLEPAAVAARLTRQPVDAPATQSLIRCAQREDTINAIEQQRYRVLERGIDTVPSVVIDRTRLDDPWALEQYARLLSTSKDAPR